MIEELYAIFKQSGGVTIDSRKILPGNMFFALKGERVNGNSFAQAAIEQGAICAVIDDPAFQTHEKCFLVHDSLVALQQLAAKHRSSFEFPVLAITGSNGKTTTKELAFEVLQKKFRVFATKGNLNNHIGVPLSILSVSDAHNFAIIEMGANHQQEITSYCSIAKPTMGLITNIGKAHLEGFGGEEGVKKGKAELYTFIMQHNGVLFVNSGQEKLKDVYAQYQPVVSYGFREKDFLCGQLIGDQPFASVVIDDIEIHSALVGRYNAENILAAACIGKYFGIPIIEIKHAIETYRPKNNRSEWREIGGNHYILDAYNANPSSMQAAIENFMLMQVSPKILVLGDMLEMGAYAAQEHRHIIHLAEKGNFDMLITVGPEFKKAAGRNIHAFDNNVDAKEFLQSKKITGAYILLKGSRGMALEKILEAE